MYMHIRIYTSNVYMQFCDEKMCICSFVYITVFFKYQHVWAKTCRKILIVFRRFLRAQTILFKFLKIPSKSPGNLLRILRNLKNIVWARRNLRKNDFPLKQVCIHQRNKLLIITVYFFDIYIPALKIKLI